MSCTSLIDLATSFSSTDRRLRRRHIRCLEHTRSQERDQPT